MGNGAQLHKLLPEEINEGASEDSYTNYYLGEMNEGASEGVTQSIVWGD